MLKALTALAAAEAGQAARRGLLVYGLYAVALLIVLAAAGFALAALHTVLAFSYGSINASLIMAGGLVVLALLVLMVAAFIRRRPRPHRAALVTTTALMSAPVAVRALVAKPSRTFGILGGVLLVGSLIVRQLGRSSSGEES